MQDVTATEERVRQLAELAIIEAPLDPLVEQVCSLACAVFGVPMAAVSLIDATHQHMLACYGFDPGRIDRTDAICDLTIRRCDPLIIEDALADPRVRMNPFVVGGPHIRFYAGAPLVLNAGVPLGAFCIIDTRPRSLTPDRVAMLTGFAAIVAGQMRHHRSKMQLAHQSLLLAQRQAILQQTERFARVGGFEADPATGTMRWSDELHRLTAIDRGAVPTLDTFLSFFAGGDQTRLRRAFAGLLHDDDACDIEAQFDDGSGVPRDVHVHAESRELVAGQRRVVGIVQDITDRRAALARLEWIATHDSLTKVANRAHFNERIETAVRRADRYGQKVALFVLDIDRFKTVNDTLGHDAGDVVLCAVARRLEAAVGIRGDVARVGGDEFAVLVSRFEAEGTVAALARDILVALRQPLQHNGADLSTRATFGVAFYGFDDSGAAGLVKSADIALYEAKQAGRDGFAFYREAMREELDAKQTRLDTARRAVFAGEIEAYYQPKVCLATGAIAGFEALMRWHHPEKGLCLPHAMGDAFADPELSVAIGRGMLARVVADILTWREAGLAFGSIALNVAEPEFTTGEFAEQILGTLGAQNLPTDVLELEVTESVFLGRRSRVVSDTLRKLAAAGISIALDDFGTGFASLTHLKQYPVSTIKIDRSFVMNLETDSNDATIVEAVVSLGNALKLDVVAEGIETEAQLEFLRARGCRTGQGYLFAKPMPGSRVPYLLRHWPGTTEPAPRLAAVG